MRVVLVVLVLFVAFSRASSLRWKQRRDAFLHSRKVRSASGVSLIEQAEGVQDGSSNDGSFEGYDDDEYGSDSGTGSGFDTWGHEFQLVPAPQGNWEDSSLFQRATGGPASSSFIAVATEVYEEEDEESPSCKSNSEECGGETIASHMYTHLGRDTDAAMALCKGLAEQYQGKVVELWTDEAKHHNIYQCNIYKTRESCQVRRFNRKLHSWHFQVDTACSKWAKGKRLKTNEDEDFRPEDMFDAIDKCQNFCAQMNDKNPDSCSAIQVTFRGDKGNDDRSDWKKFIDGATFVCELFEDCDGDEEDVDGFSEINWQGGEENTFCSLRAPDSRRFRTNNGNITNSIGWFDKRHVTDFESAVDNCKELCFMVENCRFIEVQENKGLNGAPNEYQCETFTADECEFNDEVNDPHGDLIQRSLYWIDEEWIEENGNDRTILYTLEKEDEDVLLSFRVDDLPLKGPHKLVVAFSGGGIRATVGALVPMELMHEAGIKDADEYHGLSGGAWGLALSAFSWEDLNRVPNSDSPTDPGVGALYNNYPGQEQWKVTKKVTSREFGPASNLRKGQAAAWSDWRDQVAAFVSYGSDNAVMQCPGGDFEREKRLNKKQKAARLKPRLGRTCTLENWLQGPESRHKDRKLFIHASQAFYEGDSSPFYNQSGVSRYNPVSTVNECWWQIGTHNVNADGNVEHFGCLADPETVKTLVPKMNSLIGKDTRWTYQVPAHDMEIPQNQPINALTVSSSAWCVPDETPSHVAWLIRPRGPPQRFFYRRDQGRYVRKSSKWHRFAFDDYKNYKKAKANGGIRSGDFEYVSLVDGGAFNNLPVMKTIQDFAKHPKNTMVYAFDNSGSGAACDFVDQDLYRGKLKGKVHGFEKRSIPSMAIHMGLILDHNSMDNFSTDAINRACYFDLTFKPGPDYTEEQQKQRLTMRVFNLCGFVDLNTNSYQTTAEPSRLREAYPTITKAKKAKRWTSRETYEFVRGWSRHLAPNLYHYLLQDYQNGLFGDVGETEIQNIIQKLEDKVQEYSDFPTPSRHSEVPLSLCLERDQSKCANW